MDDLDMDQAFDFKTLSLDEPDEQVRKTLEQSLNIGGDQRSWQTSAISTNGQDSQMLNEENEEQSSSTTVTPDNGPWAKLPTGKEVYPFQPGVTAEKLDAMALDPNHVFKSSQTPLPYTIPTSDEYEASTSTAQTGLTSVKGKEKAGVDNIQGNNDKIPDWMLDDPEMIQQLEWNPKSTSGPNFSSQDFALDWSSSGDLSTTIDSNILFGFSSYPTYESLPISSTIAEEQHRRMTGSGFSNPTSPTLNDGGFSKYVSSNNAGMTGAASFGFKGSVPESTSIEPQTTSELIKSNASQFQNWRSAPSDNIDLDLDLDYLDDLDNNPSGIKATPGFAPAQYRHE